MFNTSPSSLFAAILFSVIGYIIFRQGRRTSNNILVAIAGTLFIYTYFIDNIYIVWAVGIGLCIAAKRFWI